MEFCACSGSLLDTGTPDKQRVVASGVKLIAMRLKADDGTFNQILASDTIDAAYVEAKINEEDESKRWYPIGEFENQEDVRADAATETLTSGANIVTQQGVRSYTGWLINFAPIYLKTLRSFKCAKFGVLIIDGCGSITGSISNDGLALRPVKVNQNSWNPTYIKQTPTVSAKVQLAFEFSQLEKDEDLRVISEDEVTADLLEVEGLLPIKGTISAPTTTGFVAALTLGFDLFLNSAKEVIPAWLAADFALLNKTTNTAVVVTSVTEVPEGTYTFVIPAQTAGDVLELSNVKTTAQKAGFSLKEEILIP